MAIKSAEILSHCQEIKPYINIKFFHYTRAFSFPQAYVSVQEVTQPAQRQKQKQV